jgi:zinc transporter, ZIP family
MMGVRQLSGDPDERSSHQPSKGLGVLVPIAIDSVLDGTLIGIGAVAGSAQGVILAVALGLEMFSSGAALSTTLARGMAKASAAAITAGIALLIVGAAAMTNLLLVGASPTVLAGLLTFASATLLFLVAEELLVRAHENAETTLGRLMFFVGYFALLALVIASSRSTT